MLNVRVEETTASLQLVTTKGASVYGITPSGRANVLATPVSNPSNGINGESIGATFRLPEGSLVVEKYSISNSSSPQYRSSSATSSHWPFGVITSATSSSWSEAYQSNGSTATIGEAIPAGGPSYYLTETTESSSSLPGPTSSFVRRDTLVQYSQAPCFAFSFDPGEVYSTAYQPYRFGIGISDTAAADCAPVQTLPSGKLHRSGYALVASWDDRVDTRTLVPVASGSSRGATFVLYKSGENLVPYEVETATFKPALPIGTRALGTPKVWLADDGSCHFQFGLADLVWRTPEGDWRSALSDSIEMNLVLDRASPGQPHMVGWKRVGNASTLLYGWYEAGDWHFDAIYSAPPGAQIRSAYTCRLANGKVAISFNSEQSGTNRAWLLVSDVAAESTGFLLN